MVLVGGLGLAAVACRQDMHDQPVLEVYEASDFFADGQGNRPPIDGTVARGFLQEDKVFFSGLEGDAFVTQLPMKASKVLLERGRNRYDVFCSPCHDRVGNGRGMIVRRGFKQPASFHEERLRNQPVGYFFSVMTRGFGEMSSYAAQIRPEDRWAITAYIRVLQLSQNTIVDQLSAESRETVLAGLSAPVTTDEAHEADDDHQPFSHTSHD